MLLNSWQNHIPELLSARQLVLSNILERIADLKVGKIVGVLLENHSIIRTVVTDLQGSISLVEDPARHVVEIIIAPSVHLSVSVK